MAAKNQQNLHVAVLPWLAFGHIIPYLELSKRIAQKGHRISFISTPRNIDRLPKLPPHLSSSIALVKIPLPRIAELPENAEATMDIHAGQMEHLKKAFDGLEPGVTRFLEDSRPDWIIYDFAAHWLPPVAVRLGISRAFFFIINAWFLAFFGAADTLISGSDYRTKPEDFMVPPKWVKFETKVAYRRFEAEWSDGASQANESGFSDFYRLGKVIVGCEAILVRHCHEFEPEWLPLLEELHHRPVIQLGLMPPKVQDHSTRLGSEVTPSQDQLVELAHGLELSGVPFFWVLRKVSESDPVDLPDGFDERVSGRGIVWRSWAPQLEILSHASVGGFLTHCGWSSIVEGLKFGHPLITLPFLVDQGLNSRVIVDKQLGMEVPRNEQDGSYTRNWVAESVKLVMLEREGRKFRERAQEMSLVFGDEDLHKRYIDNAIEFLENHTSGTRKIVA
ncbi:UNVERIFIED_CONTAM: putative UDP-rhamnose:rhamnosyltransferase 1 [Sesamum angustifolium]|uniref:Glycosyltransferase n=1 Tax=Sesamum angustifolium TaxID=2727405 RepID=A0AAW2PQM3_9LAMI